MITFYEVFYGLWQYVVPPTILTEYEYMFEFVSILLSIGLLMWFIKIFFRFFKWIAKDGK